jgi:rRNA-processing protein FCF1
MAGTQEHATKLQKVDGVSAIYSRMGERADPVIVCLAREKSDGAVVVTPDREIRNAMIAPARLRFQLTNFIKFFGLGGWFALL